MAKLHHSFTKFPLNPATLDDGDADDPLDACDTDKIFNVQVNGARWATNGGNNIWIDPLCGCKTTCRTIVEVKFGSFLDFTFDDGTTSWSSGYWNINDVLGARPVYSLRDALCGNATWDKNVTSRYVSWVEYSDEDDGCEPTLYMVFSKNGIGAFPASQSGPRWIVDDRFQTTTPDYGASPDELSTFIQSNADEKYDELDPIFSVEGQWVGPLNGGGNTETLDIGQAIILDVIVGETIGGGPVTGPNMFTPGPINSTD